MHYFRCLLVALLLNSMAVWSAFPGGKALIIIDGLVCDFCARSMEKVFGKQQEVESVTVNMDKRLVILKFKSGNALNDAQIKQFIQDAGYNTQSIQHVK
jgi:copper chaperone CopZ